MRREKYLLKNAQRNKAKTGQFEQFSHWREEFLWEVDKKYPDKVNQTYEW